MANHWVKSLRLSTWVGVAMLAWVTPASADEAALNWVRLEGADECASAPRIAQLVEERIGRSVLQTPSRAELSIEARVGPLNEGGWLAIITVNDRSGRRLGERELRVKAGPCSQLDRPASLAISLIIDPNAAGPGLLQDGALSWDAQRLLAQIELPSGDPDALLASLDFTPAPPPAPSATQASGVPLAVAAAPPYEPPSKMVSVPEADWRKLQALARAQEGVSGEPQDEPHALPAWPAYALFGLGAATAGAAIYSVVRIGDYNSDPQFLAYRAAVVDGPNGDACADARNGFTFGVSDAIRAGAVDACDKGELFNVLFWVFASTAVVSSVTGAAWLLWVSGSSTHSPSQAARLSLTPASATAFTGLQLQLRM